jgi:hypothetical protein
MATHNTATSKAVGRALLSLLLIYWTLGLTPWRAFAQASAGYVKIASTNGTSQIDTAVVDGATYQYEITTFCTPPTPPATVGVCGTNPLTGVPFFGESLPLISNPATIAFTGTGHSVTINWAAPVPVIPGIIYNVYKVEASSPNPPVAPASGAIATAN